jgi:hypothetical protein
MNYLALTVKLERWNPKDISTREILEVMERVLNRCSLTWLNGCPLLLAKVRLESRCLSWSNMLAYCAN